MFIVATYDEEGTPNAMNAAWAGACARREVALNIGSHKTTQNIVAKGAFTVSPATADLVDMEGYAIAWVARRFGVPVELIKLVSDPADESAGTLWVDGVAECSRVLGRHLGRRLR